MWVKGVQYLTLVWLAMEYRRVWRTVRPPLARVGDAGYTRHSWRWSACPYRLNQRFSTEQIHPRGGPPTQQSYCPIEIENKPQTKPRPKHHM